MAKIVLFEENEKQKSVIRFVKSFRKKSWFKKDRVEYTLIQTEAYWFVEDMLVPEFVTDRIKKDYPNAKVEVMEMDDFFEKYVLHRFWVIARYAEGYQEEYYCGHDQWNKATYTQDIPDVRMMFSESSAKDTLRTIQQTTRDRVFIRTLYLNLVNELLTPVFMITCTSKGNDETKFFKKLDGNRVRMVGTSGAAAKFTYEEVLERFAYLQQHNKNFLYAVMPVFKDNVSARNIESYMKENKVSRMVVMDLQLKHLNTRHGA